MRLSDMKIIVTGAAQGMGAHFAKRLHEAGAQVAAGDVNEAGLAELPAGIHRRRLNVADEAEVQAFVSWAHGAMGGLNGVINNAGILRDGLLVKKDKATGVTWAREFGQFGIRCVAIAPGMIETPMTQGMNQKARDALVAAVPVGRVGVPEDIWLAVKFAIECDYFNGRTIDVDGGLSM
jgi:NAD(P)-dependent dehydrogenase (short-subunit alcohol dehydrogenase family)